MLDTTHPALHTLLAILALIATPVVFARVDASLAVVVGFVADAIKFALLLAVAGFVIRSTGNNLKELNGTTYLNELEDAVRIEDEGSNQLVATCAPTNASIKNELDDSANLDMHVLPTDAELPSHTVGKNVKDVTKEQIDDVAVTVTATNDIEATCPPHITQSAPSPSLRNINHPAIESTSPKGPIQPVGVGQTSTPSTLAASYSSNAPANTNEDATTHNIMDQVHENPRQAKSRANPVEHPVAVNSDSKGDSPVSPLSVVWSRLAKKNNPTLDAEIIGSQSATHNTEEAEGRKDASEPGDQRPRYHDAPRLVPMDMDHRDVARALATFGGGETKWGQLSSDACAKIEEISSVPPQEHESVVEARNNVETVTEANPESVDIVSVKPKSSRRTVNPSHYFKRPGEASRWKRMAGTQHKAIEQNMREKHRITTTSAEAPMGSSDSFLTQDSRGPVTPPEHNDGVEIRVASPDDERVAAEPELVDEMFVADMKAEDVVATIAEPEAKPGSRTKTPAAKTVDPFADTEEDYFLCLRKPKPASRPLKRVVILFSDPPPVQWTRVYTEDQVAFLRQPEVGRSNQGPVVECTDVPVPIANYLDPTVNRDSPTSITKPILFDAMEDDFFPPKPQPKPQLKVITDWSKPEFVQIPSPLKPGCLKPDWTATKVIPALAGFEFARANGGADFGPGPSFAAKFHKRAPKPLSLAIRVPPPPPPAPAFPPGLEPPPARNAIPYLRLERNEVPMPGQWGKETTLTFFESLRGSIDKRTIPAPHVPAGARRVAFTLGVDHWDRPAHIIGSEWPLPDLEELVIHVTDEGARILPSKFLQCREGETLVVHGPKPDDGIPYYVVDKMLRDMVGNRTFFDELAHTIGTHLSISRKTRYTLRGEFAAHWLCGNFEPFETAFKARVRAHVPRRMWGEVEERITFPTNQEYMRAVGHLGNFLERSRKPIQDSWGGGWFEAEV
ncbi:hypothetical protein CcaverHIS002_0307440 [Cutaneotrichosporon cavernicola]|uniref:Uncharacterized protein n=1 Tax=Cutaneotrichosporon cavernicola TaxID=279322 RepID=A0AA48L231_9TREE|nr:uncharacterized protein CcaverHIS019_0307350 [Cutaneotrichosporon cavernicola]BEI82876.1 hypothetical protein CcaverHIS002_0307440 [Cutaneotrichosporon cavernicola]BEI90665.1 hypothetical protein CcaverHIS019_0307350 [Cutaneotrichosporon cavernicola]BEI98443.1 hypothetical protein CcaverHIS631_0307420 [Cutaneotrichosporon cavernicola]BEJ06216.1 hypothetical protein CcaverHIS641_0307380 [Cutaneotrichosporon cavernicola]